MARAFRKCVALAPPCVTPTDPNTGTTNPADCPSGDYRRADIKSYYQGTNTGWIRFWADWYDLQTDGPQFVRTPLLTALDQNIAQAKQAGLRVILTSRSYPLWANGTWKFVADYRNSSSPLSIPPGEQECFNQLAGDKGALRTRPDPVNALRFRFPISRNANAFADVCDSPTTVTYNFNVGEGSDWYYWILFLATRYNPTNRQLAPRGPFANIPLPPVPAAATIDCLEFVNEPTGAEGWPQLDASSILIAPAVVANMFRTARIIRDRDLAGVRGLLMGGPATQDILRNDTVELTSAPTFTEALLDDLRGSRLFRETRNFIWTHHNYNDVTRKRDAAPTRAGGLNADRPARTNSAAVVRNKLVAHLWKGWPRNQTADPRLFLTEGGAIRSKFNLTQRPGESDEDFAQRLTAYRDCEQAKRLRYMYERMRRERGIGRGVSLFTNWLFNQQPGSLDAGLVDPVGPGGTGRKRRAYFTWRRLATQKTTTAAPKRPTRCPTG